MVHLATSVTLSSSICLFHMGVTCAFPAKRDRSKGSQKKLMTCRCQDVAVMGCRESGELLPPVSFHFPVCGRAE